MPDAMSIPLSVLDQSPIVSGASPREAIEATIALARRADELGYQRYWCAEHHGLPSVADPAPEVLLARLSGETSRIRLGSGGIMLPHYSAFKVAEAFRMLEALAPGRIDLGVGRAPGGTRAVSVALQSGDALHFPQQIQDILKYFGDDVPDPRMRGLFAQPVVDTSPEMWILGSSDYGAQLAAQLGLPYSFAQFIGGDYPQVTRLYRQLFVPSEHLAQPHVMVTVAAIVAPTDEEAAEIALPTLLAVLRRARGLSSKLPSLEEAKAYPWTERELAEARATRNLVTGSPDTVRARIEAVVENYAADEIMVVTIAPDYALRQRSYELLACAFAAVPV
jgi:luciferase family oxidoreductase group 1